ncbi:MAG: electron transfer flavoprotein subunit alpha/FixB family protein [Lentisphaerae bacterium]|nr:electron transfer flavoprotein subunit alpha/FixB family protein [Lentisphaerota bacterium]
METVRPLARPFLVTVTACTQPSYRSFHRSRASRRQALLEWNAQAIEADPQRIGLPGSRTQVFRIFSPSEEKHKSCRYFTDAAPLAAAVRERYLQGPAQAAAVQGRAYELDGKQASYHGDVWVYVEQAEGQINDVSLELLSEARKLAADLKVHVGAVLPGHNVGSLAPSLMAQGADVVYLADDPLLRHFRPIPYKKTVGELVVKYRPQIMLFGATPLGRELAPRVAYGSDAGLTADCTSLEIDDVERSGVTLTAILKQTRPALGGNIMATIMTKGSQTQMATVRPGVFKAAAPDLTRAGTVIRHAPALSEADIRTDILSIAPLPPRSGVAEAEIVVSGGRGLGARVRYERHLRGLAAAITGTLPGRVELGASRMAVEDGFIGHDHQVGQTGQTVQPRLYFAIGISGAVQHVSGMQNADIVVAINKDAHARIFNYADFGMVADLETALPALTEAFAAGRTT